MGTERKRPKEALDCEICAKAEWTVHLTQIVEGNVLRVAVCSECAHEYGLNNPAGFSLRQLLRAARKGPGEMGPRGR
jgi:protein-arginine kinase activator protein McsA